MSERTKILDRVREALAQPATVPGHHHDQPGATPPEVSEETAAGHISEWLPAVGDSLEDRLALFRKNSEDLKTDFRVVDSLEDLHRQIAGLAGEWKKVAMHHGELTDAVCDKLGLPLCRTDDGFAPSEMETCDAGISQCDALIAQTGSVLVTARSAGGRALSALPPHHIVLARRDQLLPDLPAAFALLEERYGADYPSFISLITGPSRTGDIERILVLGAHGPKRLTVFCL